MEREINRDKKIKNKKKGVDESDELMGVSCFSLFFPSFLWPKELRQVIEV